MPLLAARYRVIAADVFTYLGDLAAVFGGINTWHWEILADGLGVRRQSLAGAAGDNRLAEHFLVAYGGRPHASHDVNGVWIERFRAGRDRDR